MASYGFIGHIAAFHELVEQWATYVERFEHFVTANDIEENKNVVVFLSVVGAKTYGPLRSLMAPEKPGEKTYKDIMDALQGHFSPKPLVIAERFRFHTRNQQEGESVTQCIAVIKKLSKHCEFGAHLHDALRDRRVCGFNTEAIQKRLLTEAALTFNRAMEIALSMETVARETHQLNSAMKVHAISMNSQHRNECVRCGKMNHKEVDCYYKD